MIKGKKRYMLLSYSLGVDIPLYPGTPPVKIQPVKEISNGDSCNTYKVEMSNHAGTHIDAPKHFYKDGKAIDDFEITSFVFKNPLIIDCQKKDEEAILLEDIENISINFSPDIVLLKTGFSKYRHNDHEKYCYDNPYLSPAGARRLKKVFPSMRALAVDCISVANHKRKEHGRETHMVLLGEEGKGVFIIEDIFLPDEDISFDEIIIAPLFLKECDSAPCTILGIFYD
ncbi:MAG: cyclase family protein [Prolixibacteraceae bacterium]|jgi:kynurenine formamidase|nr:cyclase family protein [Prolixibacteraceae bacterium]